MMPQGKFLICMELMGLEVPTLSMLQGFCFWPEP
jgi:hypothetical protein